MSFPKIVDNSILLGK